MKHHIERTFVALLTLLCTVMGTAAQNTIAIGNANMEYLSLGQSVSVPVSMTNSSDIVAVELQVKLPRGGSINTDGCQLNATRADGHQISAARIDTDNNIYKVTVFSAQNKPLKGQSGELLTLDVVTSQEWLDGRSYALTAHKALLCTSDGENVCTATANGAVAIPLTPHADIALSTTGIVTTVKKETTGTYSLTITNTGTATTGTVSLQLPSWMSLQGALMPIEAGETATAVMWSSCASVNPSPAGTVYSTRTCTPSSPRWA